MEILKSEQYISEKLNIKPVSKNRLGSFEKEPEVDDKTKQFIKDNNLVWNPVTRNYNCNGNVKVNSNIVEDGRLTIRFGYVKGNFNCAYIGLETLDGVPNKVGGYFACNGNHLTSLNYAPKEVGGYFDCKNNKLVSLEGSPKTVGDHFTCSSNFIESLKGAPQKVGKYFACASNYLKSLDNAPQEVGGDFYCSDNPQLVLPKEKPSWIKGDLI